MKRLPLILLVAAIAVIIASAYFRRTPRQPSHVHHAGRNATAPDLVPHQPGDPDHAPLPPDEVRKLPSGSVLVFASDGGKPVADVPLGLWNEKYHLALRGLTNATGNCTFERVPAGSWTLYAKHPRFVASTQACTVVEGQATQVALLLSSGGHLTGVVTDESGTPIAGAAISILDVSSKKLLHPALKTESDARGAYVIDGIPLGAAGLLVLASRYRPQDRYDLSFRIDGETVRLDLLLRPGTVLAGRVVDESGAPVPNALVSGTNEHNGVATSDAEGRFAIYGLGDNTINLFCSRKGYGTVFLRGIAAGASVELRLPKGALLAGRVTGAKPPPFFSVLLYRFEEDLGKELLIRTVPVRNAVDGAFLIDDVAPGHYWLSIDADGLIVRVRTEIVIHSGEHATAQIAAEAKP